MAEEVAPPANTIIFTTFQKYHLTQFFNNTTCYKYFTIFQKKTSPLPLPSGVAYGEEVVDELETVEEEVGSLALPSPVIVV